MARKSLFCPNSNADVRPTLAGLNLERGRDLFGDAVGEFLRPVIPTNGSTAMESPAGVVACCARCPDGVAPVGRSRR
jgi:hypothetical protein